jgi:hypothetical protein
MSMPTNAQLLRALTAGRYDQDKVSMEIVDGHDGVVNLEQIWSEVERRAGHASKALDALCEAADKLHVPIELEVHWLAYETNGYPVDDPEGDRLDDLNAEKMSNEGLAAWYAKRGFVEIGRVDHENPIMRREPATLMRRNPENGDVR